MELPLPGATVVVTPEGFHELFNTKFEDTETLLGLHRFAWLPLLGNHVNPGWVEILWTAWCEQHRTPDESWAWHPYTTAERAINILDFARRYGLPGEAKTTLATLTNHGTAILEKLEYFGDHHTSNHLANNGRGLYRLGIDLGIKKFAQLGAEILLQEARRIFWRSGILREGSSHYHLLLTRNYADAWLAARRNGGAEEKELRSIVESAIAAARGLNLQGGLPLVGDISPDCPPEFLLGILRGDGGWVEGLDKTDRNAFLELCSSCAPPPDETLSRDGWHRLSVGPWSGLWHVSPTGWTHMPGHGHQDCGGFELHNKNRPVFIDPGRGAYGETGDAAYYRSAEANNTLTVDGVDPYPPNKPYYRNKFRDQIGGPPPQVTKTNTSLELSHQGYARLRGVGKFQRRWEFNDTSMIVSDELAGTGRRLISRSFYSSLTANSDGKGVILRDENSAYRITTDTGEIKPIPTKRWTGYGRSAPAVRIEIKNASELPWQSSVRVEEI
jgi:hypothetical protein